MKQKSVDDGTLKTPAPRSSQSDMEIDDKPSCPSSDLFRFSQFSVGFSQPQLSQSAIKEKMRQKLLEMRKKRKADDISGGDGIVILFLCHSPNSDFEAQASRAYKRRKIEDRRNAKKKKEERKKQHKKIQVRPLFGDSCSL